MNNTLTIRAIPSLEGIHTLRLSWNEWQQEPERDETSIIGILSIPTEKWHILQATLKEFSKMREIKSSMIEAFSNVINEHRTSLNLCRECWSRMDEEHKDYCTTGKMYKLREIGYVMRHTPNLEIEVIT